MNIIILIVAMIVVGLIVGWLAGPIWKNKRPIGVGLMDWYVVPAMGFSDNLRNMGVAIEPALGALLVLWIICAAKK